MNQSVINPAFPLVELHRHLDGNVRLETILSLGLKHNLPLPEKNLEGLRPFIQVTEAKPDILAYFAKFEWLVRVMVDYDAVRQIAYENVEDAKNAKNNLEMDVIPGLVVGFPGHISLATA